MIGKFCVNLAEKYFHVDILHFLAIRKFAWLMFNLSYFFALSTFRKQRKKVKIKDMNSFCFRDGDNFVLYARAVKNDIILDSNRNDTRYRFTMIFFFVFFCHSKMFILIADTLKVKTTILSLCRLSQETTSLETHSRNTRPWKTKKALWRKWTEKATDEKMRDNKFSK